MRDLRKPGMAAIGLALALFACEVESTFEPSDVSVGDNDVAVSLAPDTSNDDVHQGDASAPPCGGECGEFEDCVGGTCQPTYCPPEGPYGVMPGDTLTDVVVKDCDGNDVHIHELCGANAGFFNLLAGW